MIAERLRRQFAETTPGRLLSLIWIGFAAALMALSLLMAGAISGVGGRPLPTDFITYWSAGKVASSGPVTSIYDERRLHTVQEGVAGRKFSELYWFCYPPLLFVLVVLALAQLPYPVSFLTWSFASLVAYGGCAKALFRDRMAALTLGAAPACFYCLIVAQNGLFTAALFAAFLLTLERRPVVSGLLLAALAYKPQFGVLIPIALMAGGHWRSFVTAALVIAVTLAAWQVFEPAMIPAFLHALIGANAYVLEHGAAGWRKLQSAYGLMRLLGLGTDGAAAVQIVLVLGAVAAVAAAWRARVPYERKAAILVVAALAATPYIFIYDLPLLTVAVGYLYRERPFSRGEYGLVWGAYALIAAFPLVIFPVGIPAIGLIAAVIARRANEKGGVAASLRITG